jgi:dTDP-4-amino-4,6-dideoxygalactose transaminase
VDRGPSGLNPASDWASGALITLPLHLHLDEEDLERVVEHLASALASTAT